MRHPAAAHRYDVLYDPATILTVVGTAASVVGQLSAGKSAQNEANFRADLSRQSAERERQVSELEAGQFRKDQSALAARRRAKLAGSGIVTTAGSPLLVSEDIQAEIARNEQLIRHGGDVRATRLEQEAGLLNFSGKNARRSSQFGAATSLLKGASKIDFKKKKTALTEGREFG